MKLAGLCPIGSLAEYGYQYVYHECIASQARLCDTVFLVQSLNDRRNLDELLSEFPNVRLVSNKDTWYPDGKYSVAHSQERAIYDQHLIKDAGYDVLFLLASNSYIPDNRAQMIRSWCEDFYALGRSIGYVFRGDQLGGTLFHASKKLPYLLRLSDFPAAWISYVPDGAYIDDEFFTVEPGDFASFDPIAFVDAPMEMTLLELEAKINFVHGYHDIMPKRPEVFDWDYWRLYYLNKFRQKRVSDEPLSETGLEIARNHSPDFVSAELLRELCGR